MDPFHDASYFFISVFCPDRTDILSSQLQWVYCTTWPAVAHAGEAHVTFTAFPLSFPCDAHIPHLRQSDLCARPAHTRIKLRSVSFVCNVFKMPTYTLQQRIFMYDSYVITSSCWEIVTRFQANYPGLRVPSREAVRLLVNKFRETGTFPTSLVIRCVCFLF